MFTKVVAAAVGAGVLVALPAAPARAGAVDQVEVQAIVTAAYNSLKPAAQDDVCWGWNHMRPKAIKRLSKTFKDTDYSAADVKAGISKALSQLC